MEEAGVKRVVILQKNIINNINTWQSGGRGDWLCVEKSLLHKDLDINIH